MKCPICESEKGYDYAFNGPIRSAGAYSGTEEGYTVKRCRACTVEFLQPFPYGLMEFYSGDDYWSGRVKSVDKTSLREKLGWEQQRWLEEIGPENLRGKQLVDIGCGAGLFLDLAAPLCASTAGVEPSRRFESVLRDAGHGYFADCTDLDSEKTEVAVCFDTLEHVPDPMRFLKEIRRCMIPGGTIYLGVPNCDEFLKSLVREYLSFFYHKSHLYYFSARSLQVLLGRAGFEVQRMSFVHKYTIMNMVIWARDRKPSGRTKGPFDAGCEAAFVEGVERQGLASHVFVEAVKAGI